ncbi:Disulfide-bond oxidoreductase YfcG [Meyerozyma sp. JA9]|nr:Disulfide-bond oxidoreductase YfcG [Meyerozyma sp. JA9]
MSTPLKLYTAKTPNGIKISIFLELLGLKYDYQLLSIANNGTKEPWFIAKNPNGRIPTLEDKSTGITISESGAILQYLADTYDKDHKYSYKHGTKEYYLQLETLYWQMAGLGPMQGQANHFKLYAPEKIPYGINRYINEAKRLYSVLEIFLKNNEKNGPYLVGNHLSISDIASYSWARSAERLGISLEEWPLVAKWFRNIDSIPEVQKGIDFDV